MRGRRRTHLFTPFQALAIVVLVGLGMPAGPAVAAATMESARGGRSHLDVPPRAIPPAAPAAAQPGKAGAQAEAASVPLDTNLFQDPGFELYYPNPYWTEFDSMD